MATASISTYILGCEEYQYLWCVIANFKQYLNPVAKKIRGLVDRKSFFPLHNISNPSKTTMIHVIFKTSIKKQWSTIACSIYIMLYVKDAKNYADSI